MPEAVEFLTPADLRDILRGMAAVSVLFQPREAFRDHRFRETGDTDTAQWGDFAGNRCHFLFSPAGSVILGFDHESPMSPHATCTGPDDFRAWPGVYESLPRPLMDVVLARPFGEEFDYREVTFCLWNRSGGRTWQKGDIDYPARDHGDADGQRYILDCLREYHLDFAGEFRERYKWELDDEAVAELLSGDETTRDCLRHLKPNCDLEAVVPELLAMGFRVV